MVRKIEDGAEVLAIIFGLAAAIFWMLASIESTPDNVAAAMQQNGGMDVFGSDLSNLINGLIKQGKLNAYASGCAALAAIAQSLVLYLRRFQRRV